jgi:hypothetical protein
VRLLFAIAHLFDPGSGEGHGSLRADPRPRVASLAAALVALHRSFGPRQYTIEIAGRRALQANDAGENVVDVVICTTGGRHLLDHLRLPAGAFTHCPTSVDPMLLGFECQAVLRDALGRYDYHCYLEDDLVIHDPAFFAKLAWFAELAGDEALLQPNRYELDARFGGRKAYVDGDLVPEATAPFQDVGDRPVVSGEALGREIVMRRTLNPHAGCYFLSQAQMSAWASRPDFLDRDTSFVGPLESAATLGIMRAFRVYKPEDRCASFLELEHASPAFMSYLDEAGPAARPPFPLGPGPAAG